MAIYYHSKKIENLRFDGKKMSKGYFQNKLIFFLMLNSGTILWSGSLAVKFSVKSDITMKNVRIDFRNIKNGIEIQWHEIRNPDTTKSFSVKELRDRAILPYSSSSGGAAAEVKILKGTNILEFTGRSVNPITITNIKVI